MISDTKSGLTMARAIARPESTLLSPKHLLSPNGKMLMNLQSIKNGSTTNALVLDSMRASSPTSRRARDDEDQKSWTLHHPSALSKFEEIMIGSTGKQIIVFLDYDGTLSPIVDDPDRAYITGDMREAVRDVARFFPTAIVSGRCREKVYDFVRLPELYYAGSHGMDIKGPAKRKQRKGNQTVLCQPATEFLPIIDEVYRSLMEKINYIPGAKVENNKFCLSVHYRCVEEKRWGEVAGQVKSAIKYYQQLSLSQGRKVFEIRPMIKWDKGNALQFLLESLGYAESDDVLPVYIGDDRTDEDAFKVLRNRGQGVGILVSKAPKETNSSYTLQEPSEVMQFLKRLVECKKTNQSYIPTKALEDPTLLT